MAVSSPALPRVRSISPKASAYLDVMRAAAAFAVFAGHARALFFAEATRLDHPSLFTRAFYFMTGFGRISVMIFFVISGLLVGYSTLTAIQEDRWSWTAYGINRFSRLYAALVPALVLGFLLDKLGVHFLNSISGVYSMREISGLMFGAPVTQFLGWKTFVGNLLFLQTIKVTCLGSNTALWSLSNEFWYYVLFPLAALALWGRNRGGARWMGVALFGMVAYGIGWEISRYFAVWLMGVGAGAAARRYGSRVGKNYFGVLRAVSLVVFVASISLARARFFSSMFRADVGVGVASTLLIFAFLVTFPSDEAAPRWTRVFRWAAVFSYSLYVLHLPLLVFLRATRPSFDWPVTGVSIILYSGILAIGFFYAWAVANAGEFRTERIRRFLRGVFPRS